MLVGPRVFYNLISETRQQAAATGRACRAAPGHIGSTLNYLIKQLQSSSPSWLIGWLAVATGLACWGINVGGDASCYTLGWGEVPTFNVPKGEKKFEANFVTHIGILKETGNYIQLISNSAAK